MAHTQNIIVLKIIGGTELQMAYKDIYTYIYLRRIIAFCIVLERIHFALDCFAFAATSTGTMLRFYVYNGYCLPYIVKRRF